MWQKCYECAACPIPVTGVSRGKFLRYLVWPQIVGKPLKSDETAIESLPL